MPGPYVYTDVDDLEATDKVGSGQCVVLVQHYAAAPVTSQWREGAAVRGQALLAKGTAIATFVGGRYESHRHGNHAALYLRQDATGIWIMDQWTSAKTKPRVSSRHIAFKGKDKNGNYVDPSNNADAFAVIN
ncbi:BPSL0067 family protein [Sphingomonas sp.]|uniref:BPSL0067 family protein n=1 Tax=Sphingomonas sp. TaxID=28214 RepID=UPI003CC652FE